MLGYPFILRPLPRSRKRPKPGDIFAYTADSKTWWFGRVVRTKVGQLGNSNMIYLYDATSPSVESIPELDCGRLIAPPELINNQAWLQGDVVTILNRPLGPGDVLPVHAFYDIITKKHYDEDGRRVESPPALASIFATGHGGVINNALCKHLGIEKVEDPVWPD